MTLLLTYESIVLRRVVGFRGLNGLADSLAADLAPVLERELYVPEEKALLSRAGGRCPTHGGLLNFDPWSPHEHRCPVDGERFTGVDHDRFWIYWYQLWLAERAVHAAVLYGLRGAPEYGSLATRIVEAFADRYLSYPNVDNALGPTRPFFSTYLESIWLLQLCLALDLVELTDRSASIRALGGRVRDRLIEPSARLIASYDEGMSNRQVWNNAALIAANGLLRRPREVEAAVVGRSGLAAHLAKGLLSDGTWYEGENYHLFAHRGLWYGVGMAERASLELRPALIERFHEGFATPFLTALPDMTLPSRRDSQYAISLRQWRFAELCELGLAHRDDPRLMSALARLYGDGVARGDTGRARSSAETERNERPTALTRSDLGWRSLLFARETLPPLEALPPRSVLLEAQGLAVLRRAEGRVYIALDYGHSGGGHGHPDRLNLLLADGDARWFDDMGTGSYVDASLHWYRSTLAHNAPLVDGRSQDRVHGTLLAFQENGGVGWVTADAKIAHGVQATRTIVAMPDYLIDVVEWSAASKVVFDLPLHLTAGLVDPALQFETADLEGSRGEEDGFRFVHGARCAHIPMMQTVHLRAHIRGRMLDLWLSCVHETELWRCRVPGPPGGGEQELLLLRAFEEHGTIRMVSTWCNAIGTVTFGESLGIDLLDGTRQEHRKTPDGWRVDLSAGAAHSTIDLGKVACRPVLTLERSASVPRRPSGEGRAGDGPRIDLVRGRVERLEMGMANYRQSEESWKSAGRPHASVTFLWNEHTLALCIAVHRVDRSFVPPGTINPYDNEPADINGAGVQLYLAVSCDQMAGSTSEDVAGAAGHDPVGWMLVPLEGSDAVAIRLIGTAELASSFSMTATWRALPDGYEIDAQLGPIPGNCGEGMRDSIRMDVIVNEKPFARVRRRGQLVLSGGEGDFVYLRGDRNDPSRLIPIELHDA